MIHGVTYKTYTFICVFLRHGDLLSIGYPFLMFQLFLRSLFIICHQKLIKRENTFVKKKKSKFNQSVHYFINVTEIFLYNF